MHFIFVRLSLTLITKNCQTSSLTEDLVIDFQMEQMIPNSPALRGLWLHMNFNMQRTICSQLTPTQDLGILCSNTVLLNYLARLIMSIAEKLNLAVL